MVLTETQDILIFFQKTRMLLTFKDKILLKIPGRLRALVLLPTFYSSDFSFQTFHLKNCFTFKCFIPQTFHF
jgi:hypothetical protein